VGGGSGSSNWINSGTLTVGYSGTATLTVNSGGVVQAAGLEGGNSQSSIRLNGGTLAISTSNTSSNRIELQAGGGTVRSMGNSIVVMNGTLSGPGHLTKTGTGVLQLTGNNSYQGGTTLKAGGSTVVTAPNALGTGTVTVEGGATLSYNNAANLAAPVELAGGSYNRFISSSTTLANRINATSSFAGGAPDTEARLLAGTASMNLTMLSSFAPDSSATNDFLRQSDVYDLSFLPSSGAGNGIGTVGYVLQLSTAGSLGGTYLGWLDPETNQWVNAVTGNLGEPSSHAGSPFTSGTFADFQALYGTNVSNYMGAWGSYEVGGVTSTWAVLNHNSSFAIIPEPSASLLAGLGLGSVVFSRRRRMHV
jgi:fibronectin-binding autotransporter adhesin